MLIHKYIEKYGVSVQQSRLLQEIFLRRQKWWSSASCFLCKQDGDRKIFFYKSVWYNL